MKTHAVIKHVSCLHVQTSMWGAFWESQRTAPSMSPMSIYPAYSKSLDSWWSPQAQLIVRIEDSLGHVGVGWSEDGTGAGKAVVENHFRRLLLGQSADATSVLQEQLYRASIPYGRGGVVMEALSAVDLALWDLRGHAMGKPVHALIGGRHRDTLEVYASHLQPVEAEKLVSEAKGYVAEGYRAMKMRMAAGPTQGRAGIARNLELVGLIRDAIGPEIDLMVDAYMGWDATFARTMAQELDAFGVGWIEEPLLPDCWDAYAALTAMSPVPIAQGENSFIRAEFLRICSNGEANILQPDIHRCGGVTGFLNAARIAADHGMMVAPHAYSAPTVHACLALPNVKLVEKLTVPNWWKAESSEDAPPLILDEPVVVNGKVSVSDAPGFGTRLNLDHPAIPAEWR